jgi:FtsH-binding integral membrane protein
MNRIKQMLPYLIATIIAFYLLPLFGRDTGSFMIILLIAIPLLCFISALSYGYKRGFDIIYSVIVGLLFIPTIFIYYNSTALIYIFIYAVIALIGSIIGTLVNKKV